MNTGNFLAELKRGNVYKVAVAYPIVSWLLFQIVISTSGRGPSVAGERALFLWRRARFPGSAEGLGSHRESRADQRSQLSARTAICVPAGKELSGPHNS